MRSNHRQTAVLQKNGRGPRRNRGAGSKLPRWSQLRRSNTIGNNAAWRNIPGKRGIIGGEENYESEAFEDILFLAGHLAGFNLAISVGSIVTMTMSVVVAQNGLAAGIMMDQLRGLEQAMGADGQPKQRHHHGHYFAPKPHRLS